MENLVQTKVMTGKEAVVLSLIKEGVTTIFGYPGGAIMPVYDALFDYEDEIKHILTRHEQGAVHAAQGFARASGKVGVCMATSGPGATNLVTGIADAYIDSTPIVCITGQVSSNLLGTDAFQETDVVGITMPVTKWNIQVSKAEDIPTAISKAFYIARSGRPGPVVIDITKDAQFGSLEFEYKFTKHLRSYVPEPAIDEWYLKNAADLINNAKRPLVLLGQGVLLGDAKEEFKAFVEKAGLPTAWTILGLSAFDSYHPLNVGMLGMHGNYAPNKLSCKADVVIAVGMRFDDRVTGNTDTFLKKAKVIHMEIDPAEVNKNIVADVPVLGNCKTSLPRLTALLKENKHPEWLQQFHDFYDNEYQSVIKNELNPSPEKMISMGEVIEIISKKTDGRAIVVTDVGQHQMVTERYYKFKEWNSNITSGGLGTMGFALPAAIGAKISSPHRKVIAVVGDGGFQMTIQELGTLFQYEIDIKILILNNEFLGMVRQWQELFFDRRYYSTMMVNPDFQMIAKGYSVSSQKVTERQNLNQAIDQFLNTEGSALLEVLVGRENNVFPFIPTGSCVSEIRLK